MTPTEAVGETTETDHATIEIEGEMIETVDGSMRETVDVKMAETVEETMITTETESEKESETTTAVNHKLNHNHRPTTVEHHPSLLTGTGLIDHREEVVDMATVDLVQEVAMASQEAEEDMEWEVVVTEGIVDRIGITNLMQTTTESQAQDTGMGMTVVVALEKKHL